MAGSYGHVVRDDGGLGNNDHITSMLENGGDVFEAIEEMYGMLWYLAKSLEMETGRAAATLIAEAQAHYKEGLASSPTSVSD